MDCGLFDKTVIPLLKLTAHTLYLGTAVRNFYDQIREITRWETVTIGMKDYEVASLNMPPLEERKYTASALWLSPQNG